jgi:hypothetical protein
VKTRGSAATLGLKLAPPRNLSYNQRGRAARQNPRGILWIRARRTVGDAVNKMNALSWSVRVLIEAAR